VTTPATGQGPSADLKRSEALLREARAALRRLDTLIPSASGTSRMARSSPRSLPHFVQVSHVPTLAELVDGIIGVDTHRDSLVAAAVTPIGARTERTPTAGGAPEALSASSWSRAIPSRTR
jgi:hypothetical protein